MSVLSTGTDGKKLERKDGFGLKDHSTRKFHRLLGIPFERYARLVRVWGELECATSDLPATGFLAMHGHVSYHRKCRKCRTLSGFSEEQKQLCAKDALGRFTVFPFLSHLYNAYTPQNDVRSNLVVEETEI